MENKEIAVQVKKVALYCRVSTNKQTNENQKIRLLQYATDMAYQFDLYEEVESTRKTRPVKQELLQKLRKGEYSHIIVYKLDRFARSSRELILEVQELIDKGIAFVSLYDNLDFSNSLLSPFVIRALDRHWQVSKGIISIGVNLPGYPESPA